METVHTPRYTRVFRPSEETLARFPGHLEVRRFDALTSAELPGLWKARRRRAPCDVEVANDWGLDAIFFRAPEEEEYARLLSQLQISAIVWQSSLGGGLLCLPSPVVPHR